MQTTHTFHISGMHCNACTILTESKLGGLPGVTHIKASLHNHQIQVTGDFGDKTVEQIAKEFSEHLHDHGYVVSVEKKIHVAH